MKTYPEDLSKKLDEISSWMFPAGSQKRVCELSGYKPSYVSKMLNKKKYPTPEFLLAAERVMLENRVKFRMEPVMKAS